ncbi:MAG: M20/M25/M40 family metallo-hydrolase [bacterium]
MKVLSTKTINEAVEARFAEQVKFLSQLVKAKSVNSFDPIDSPENIAVEGNVAELIYKKLDEFGLQPKYRGTNKIRCNVVAEWGDRRARKTIMLNGHMDTAQVDETVIKTPFSGKVRAGKLYGAGACDMKATLTAYIYAVNALKELGAEISGRVMMAFVVDEESGASSRFGTKFLLEDGYIPKACLIGEPGTEYVRIGHRGLYRFKLVVFGEAVHTGIGAWERGEKGHNAVVDMARAIETLQGLEIPFKQSKTFPNRRPVFTFPTKMKGGISTSAVPSKAEAYGDVRLLPGNSDTQVKLLIVEKLYKLGIKYDLQDLLFVPAVEIDPKEEVVVNLQQAINDVTGRTPDTRGAGPGNDAHWLVKRDIPTVCGYGPDGGGEHGENEWVDLESLKQVTKVYAKFILSMVI